MFPAASTAVTVKVCWPALSVLTSVVIVPVFSLPTR